MRRLTDDSIDRRRFVDHGAGHHFSACQSVCHEPGRVISVDPVRLFGVGRLLPARARHKPKRPPTAYYLIKQASQEAHQDGSGLASLFLVTRSPDILISMRMASDIATMYHTGLAPFTGEEVYFAKNLRDRKLQRALLQVFKPENSFEVRQALSAS
jgi:hypothetical protein